MNSLPMTGFKGVNEVTSPEKLSADELVALDNMRLDEEMGIATTRKGFARYNISPTTVSISNAVAGVGIVTVTATGHNLVSTESVVISGVVGMIDLNNTFVVTVLTADTFTVPLSTVQTYTSGGSILLSATINNLFDIKDINSNNYLLANVGTKLKKSTNGTGVWTNIKTGLTSAKMRMAAYGNKFLFTNGNENLFYTDLTSVWNVGIDKPDITGITAVVTEGTNIVPGASVYILVYVTDDGQKSNASNKFRILDNGQLFTSVAINNIPVSSDSRVITKKIYRTKNGIYNTFYLLGEIDNAVTTFTDNIADSSLDSTETIEYLNVPTKAKYIMTTGERIWLANFSKKMTNRIIPPVFIYDYGKNGGLGGDGVWISDDPGVMGAGTYKYAVSFIDTQGNESELVSYFEHTLAAGSLQISFYLNYVYPFDNIDFNTAMMTMIAGIKSIRLYRTKANGSTYYFHSDVAVPTQPVISLPTQTDNTNDTGLTIAAPKETVHNNTEVTSLSYSVVYSNLNNFIEYPELNYIEVYPDDSEMITGIFDDDNGVMIFKENSICKIFTTGDPSNWQTQKLVENVGCDQPDSIYKYQSNYFFVFRNKVYVYSGGQVKEISYKRKTTFDSITSFLGASFWHSALWYVLTVKIGSSYYLLCYDLKLEGWYKYSINQSDTILEKKFGTDKGKLLFGGNQYITYYNESQVYDNDSGTKADITVNLKTKDYSFPDNFVVARLMFFLVNYYRLINTIAQQITFTLADPVTGITTELTDYDETTLQNIWKIPTDGMNGTLQRCSKLSLTVSGVALSKLYSARLDYNTEHWRIPQKSVRRTALDESGAFMADDFKNPGVDDGGGKATY